MSGAERGAAWDRYRTAAARGVAAHNLPAERPGGLGCLREWTARLWASSDEPAPVQSTSRFRDLRLVPIGGSAWAGAAAAPFLGQHLDGAPGWGGGMACVVIVLLVVAAGIAGTGLLGARRAARALVLPGCAALALVAGLTAAASHAAAERAGPAGELLTVGGQTRAVVLVSAEPRQQAQGGRFGSADRFLAGARLERATGQGVEFASSARILLAGGKDLSGLRPGQRVSVAGTVTPAREPSGAALLSISSRPRVLGTDAALGAAAEARAALRASSDWLSPEAAGLLSGITVGDTSVLPLELEAAMREVGLGHLTAVSGANFTILLGAALLTLRALRAPRWAALSGCAAVLLAFALVVGPEPSVLRAAVMGAVGLVALATGRAGRSCSALSAAVLVLVLADPPLGASLGFLLSVMATLGIVLLGPPLSAVLAARLPLWMALSISVPLSAQLLCGPITVLIQPAFLSLSLISNIVVAPLVPVITVAGTVALALGTAQPLAIAAAGVGGAAAQLLALIASGFAAVPGAALPWPEGVAGAAAMAAFSGLNILLLWTAMVPAGRARAAGLVRWAVELLLVQWARVRRLAGILGLGLRPGRGRVDG
ncbi:ComEC/Rec2 family competence protein [Sinomonas flava]|uniref:ComEC/Rec2-related protein domain-containing protein n=1 Tax=Sinomonas flava TaxID=496857 RepID=A0ABP5NCL5_9MICC